MSVINVDTVQPFTSGVTVVDVNGVDISGTSGSVSQKSYAIGFEAGDSQTGSLAIGTYALKNATSFNNTAVGNLALQNPSLNCTALGYGAGAGTSAASGTFVGYNAGTSATSGFANTIVGSEAGSFLTTGEKNVLIGWRAGVGNSGAPGTLTSGSNNVFIGTNGLDVSPTLSNTIILGDGSISTLACQVTSITSLSDGRDKKEVETIPVGLEFINELKPVKFVWDDRNENGKHDVKDCGFIAQDLKELQEKYNVAEELQLVNEGIAEDKMYASYGKLLPILVKAVQELSAEVKALKANK